MPSDPLLIEAIARFQEILGRAASSGLNDPTAMCLATATPDGRPSARMVLLKTADERGFVFYTNLHSRKGRELERNPRVALCLYWDPLGEQVRVEGGVEAVSTAEADAYWASRPLASRIASAASLQSQPLDSRGLLIARVAGVTAQAPFQGVPRPPQWSGFRVIPERIEFWKAGDARLNHRTLYERTDEGWESGLLYP